MIFTVVGARPNFIKMAPVVLELKRRGILQVFVHTGQHYDAELSAVFFQELGMPEPDVYLGVGSASHAVQTARVMVAFEEECLQRNPSLVVVAGDVNSTLACALSAAKLNIPVAHVEAGLRSFDRTMPEEVNRVLTDHVSELLFVTEPSGRANLLEEGVPEGKIFFVGNTMIDTLHVHLPSALEKAPWEMFDLRPQSYFLVTLHRPSNVDNAESLMEIMSALENLGQNKPVLFPVHPRTQKRLSEIGFQGENVMVVNPQGYLDFLGLMAQASLVLTDSGGIQEETTALRISCVTIRKNTERPVTVESGTNILAGTGKVGILEAATKALSRQKPVAPPDLWDGRAGRRVVDVIGRWLRKDG